MVSFCYLQELARKLGNLTHLPDHQLIGESTEQNAQSDQEMDEDVSLASSVSETSNEQDYRDVRFLKTLSRIEEIS